MSFLDTMLTQVSDTGTIENLAAKVGLSPAQVEQAVAALGAAHASEGNTVATAAQNTGLPESKLNQIVGEMGGEGALSRFSSLLQQQGGGLAGGISKFL